MGHTAPSPYLLAPDLLFGGLKCGIITPDDWIIHRKLGEGSFGTVYLATLKVKREKSKKEKAKKKKKEGRKKKGEKSNEKEEGRKRKKKNHNKKNHKKDQKESWTEMSVVIKVMRTETGDFWNDANPQVLFLSF